MIILDHYTRNGVLIFMNDFEKQIGRDWARENAPTCGKFNAPYHAEMVLQSFLADHYPEVFPETRQVLLESWVAAAQYEACDAHSLETARDQFAHSKENLERVQDELVEYDANDTALQLIDTEIQRWQQARETHIQNVGRQALVEKVEYNQKVVEQAERELREMVKTTFDLTSDKKLIPQGVTVATVRRVQVKDQDQVLAFLNRRMQEVGTDSPLYSTYRNAVQLNERAFGKLITDGKVNPEGMAEIISETQVRVSKDLHAFIEPTEEK